MRLHRRELLAGMAIPMLRAAAPGRWLYIGAYTSEKNRGITAVQFDGATGAFGPTRLAAETPNPTFLAIHPSRRFLYAANEVGLFEGQKTGSVTAFQVDEATGVLGLLNRVSSQGPGPCHVSTDQTGRVLMVANYGGGNVASYLIDPKGKLSEAVSVHRHEGSGPNTRRQEGPHAHCIYPSPGNRYALACDLGTDHVHVYALDSKTGRLTPAGQFKVADGAGPRHLAWHPKGRFAYVINELNSTVSTFAWNESSGSLKLLGSVTTLPANFSGANTTAEVRVHPNGNFLYASNRGHDSISLFEIRPEGWLAYRQSTPVEGQMPRNFNLDPTGQWLISANQRSDNLVVFRVDPATGRLDLTPNRLNVGAPVCLRFLA